MFQLTSPSILHFFLYHWKTANPAKTCNSKYWQFQSWGIYWYIWWTRCTHSPRKVNADCLSCPEGPALQNYDTAYNT